MKRFARILGIIAGIGVIVWAVRDRFVSLTVPKEPEPPAFRTPPTPARPTPAEDPGAVAASGEPAGAPPVASADDLTEVKGIGPVFAGRLTEAGITSFAELAAASEEALTEILESRLGSIDSILEDARRLAGS